MGKLDMSDDVARHLGDMALQVQAALRGNDDVLCASCGQPAPAVADRSVQLVLVDSKADAVVQVTHTACMPSAVVEGAPGLLDEGADAAAVFGARDLSPRAIMAWRMTNVQVFVDVGSQEPNSPIGAFLHAGFELAMPPIEQLQPAPIPGWNVHVHDRVATLTDDTGETHYHGGGPDNDWVALARTDGGRCLLLFAAGTVNTPDLGQDLHAVAEHGLMVAATITVNA